MYVYTFLCTYTCMHTYIIHIPNHVCESLTILYYLLSVITLTN